MEQTSRRKLGDASGKGGSSGIAIDGGTEPARPPVPDGWTDVLQVVEEVERAGTRPGMMSLLRGQFDYLHGVGKSESTVPDQ